MQDLVPSKCFHSMVLISTTRDCEHLIAQILQPYTRNGNGGNRSCSHCVHVVHLGSRVFAEDELAPVEIIYLYDFAKVQTVLLKYNLYIWLLKGLFFFLFYSSYSYSCADSSFFSSSSSSSSSCSFHCCRCSCCCCCCCHVCGQKRNHGAYKWKQFFRRHAVYIC